MFWLLWHPKTFQSIYSVFSLFADFSIAGSSPKWFKILCQYPLKFGHPKIVEKSRKPPLNPGSVRNRFCPPPPAKADIATWINKLCHWALMCRRLPPNKHAFTAKAARADFQPHAGSTASRHHSLQFFDQLLLHVCSVDSGLECVADSSGVGSTSQCP